MRKQVDRSSETRHPRRRVSGLISLIFTDTLGVVSGITLAALLVLTLVNVIKRETTGRGIDGTIEYTEVLMVIAMFLALALAQRNGTHISTSFVTNIMPRTLAHILNRVVGAFGVLVIGMIIFSAYDAYTFSIERGEYTMGIARVELWPARLAVLVGMIVYLYEYGRVIVRGPSMKSVAEEAEAEFIHETGNRTDV